MKNMTIITLALIGMTTFSSCDKINDTTWVYYEETGCADPWGTTENTSETDKNKAVKAYFKDKGSKIYKIEITDEGTFEACKACHCKTGKLIKCKIKDEDVDIFLNEGFYQ